MEMSTEKERTETTDAPPSRITCRHYLMFFILSAYLFSTVTISLVETQYAYFAIQKQKNITSDVSKSRQTLCEVNTTTVRYHQQQEVQKETAQWNTYCHLASSFPALVTTLFVGSWSDRIGRKVALLFPICGILFKATFTVVAIKLEWNIYYFPIAFFVEGMFGMYLIVISASVAFAADLTRYGKDRTFGITLMEIFIGLGVAISNFCSGYLIKYLGFLYTLVICIGVSFLTGLVILFLPESIKKKQELQAISQIKYLKNAVEFYIKKGPMRWKYIILAIAFSFSALPNVGRINVQTLYLLNSPFCWNSVLIGWYGMSRSVIQMLIGLGLIRLLQRCLTERKMFIVGSISSIGYYILMAVSFNGTMVFLTSVIGILGMYPLPMIRSILSGITPKEKQGAMFGSITAVDAVCSLLGSALANTIYAETAHIYRGIIMIIFALYSAIALGFISFMLFKEAKEKKVNSDTTDKDNVVYVMKM